MENTSIYRQADEVGLTKEELDFLADFMQKYDNSLKDFKKEKEAMLSLSDSLSKIKDNFGDDLNIIAKPVGEDGTFLDLDDFKFKITEYIDKMNKQHDVVKSCVSKLNKLKELYE
jgi:hypothetical protein